LSHINTNSKCQEEEGFYMATDVTIGKTSGVIDIRGAFNTASTNSDNIHSQRFNSAYDSDGDAKKMAVAKAHGEERSVFYMV